MASIDSFDVVTPKKYINTFALPQLEQRLQRLYHPIPGVVRYTNEVKVSPLYVTVKAADATQQLFKGALRELQRPLPEDEALEDLTRMARVVLNLHQRDIVHGKLSLQSWREDENHEMVIIDAALPISLIPVAAPALQSIAHLLAPEVVAVAGGGEGATKEQQVIPASDVWGLAITFLQMVLKDKQFNTFDRADVMDADLMCPLTNGFSPKTVSLLIRCLKQDPLLRPSLEELFCELSGQPSARQAAMMAEFAADDDEEEEFDEGDSDEEEDEDAD